MNLKRLVRISLIALSLSMILPIASAAGCSGAPSSNTRNPDTGAPLSEGQQFFVTNQSGGPNGTVLLVTAVYSSNPGGSVWGNNGAWGTVEVGGTLVMGASHTYYRPGCKTATPVAVTTPTPTPTPTVAKPTPVVDTPTVTPTPLVSAAPVPKYITCVNFSTGRSVRSVTPYKPSCPKGYSAYNYIEVPTDEIVKPGLPKNSPAAQVIKVKTCYKPSDKNRTKGVTVRKESFDGSQPKCPAGYK